MELDLGAAATYPVAQRGCLPPINGRYDVKEVTKVKEFLVVPSTCLNGNTCVVLAQLG